jgi:two-component system KDP operon response regulator KdpE
VEASLDDAMNISRAHRILVIEDEGHVAGFIRDALTEIGYAVTVAAGGADALNKVTDDAPDLVLLDLNLPDMPGFEVLDRLRARSPALPVVIVSGNTDPMMAEAALALGAVDYVTKPVTLDRLSEAVAAALRLRSELVRKK